MLALHVLRENSKKQRPYKKYEKEKEKKKSNMWSQKNTT